MIKDFHIADNERTHIFARTWQSGSILLQDLYPFLLVSWRATIQLSRNHIGRQRKVAIKQLKG